MKFIVVKKRYLLLVVIMLAVVVVSAGIVKATSAASVYFGKVERKLPVYCVDVTDKKVALTFDASWGADNTKQILRILEENDVSATYFVVGIWAEKYRDILKELSDSSLIEIGTHSMNHLHMSKLSQKQMELELTQSSKLIEDITGKKVCVFRAPFGEYNETLIDTAHSLNLQTIQWDVDSLDWKDVPADKMTSKILSNSKPGSIILMHNAGKYTTKALPNIIKGFKSAGYSMVKISDLIYKDNFTIDHTGKQIHK